jgi:MFS family permease
MTPTALSIISTTCPDGAERNKALGIWGALGVAVATTVAVSRSQHLLTANGGANPLVVLNEGFRSAFLAIVALAGVGMALALLLPGRPRPARRQHLDPAPATSAGGLRNDSGR